MQRQETHTIDLKMGDDFHLDKIGTLIEANESQLRAEMDSIYISKTKQIINTGRLREDYMTRD